MSNHKTLIFTGMHRSGTSLIANLLKQAGVDMGETLLEADSRNRHGFYEDADFYQFHQQALYRCGEPTPYVKVDFAYLPTPAEIEKANSLIEQKHNHPLWGWKDPRTCLFLDFWHQLLPEARYLFVYRHPLEVLVSFVRRGEAHTPGLLEAMTSWQIYNSRIVAFYREHPNNCLLCHTFSVVEQIDGFKNLLDHKLDLQLELDSSVLESLYHPEELRRVSPTPGVESLLLNIIPDTVALYHQLNSMADLPLLPCEDRQQSTVGLSAFSDFVADLPAPHSPSRVRGLLFLLLSFLEPDLIDTFFKKHGQYIIQLEYNQKAWIEKQDEVIRNQKTWIEKQDEVIRNQKTWIDNQKTWIDNLETNLANIQNSYTWRLGQRLANSLLGRGIRYLLRLGRPKKQI